MIHANTDIRDGLRKNKSAGSQEAAMRAGLWASSRRMLIRIDNRFHL